MRGELRGTGHMRPRRTHRAAVDGLPDHRDHGAHLGSEAEVALPAAAQLEIDFGQQLRIEQRAVIDTVSI